MFINLDHVFNLTKNGAVSVVFICGSRVNIEMSIIYT